MMNFAAYHSTVEIFREKENGGDVVFNDVQLVASGNFLIINSTPTRNEETHEKHVITVVFNLKDIIGYNTTTKYYPEQGLENRQQING